MPISCRSKRARRCVHDCAEAQRRPIAQERHAHSPAAGAEFPRLGARTRARCSRSPRWHDARCLLSPTQEGACAMSTWTAVTPSTLILPNDLALLVAPVCIAGEPRSIEGSVGHAEGVVLDAAGRVAG